MEVNYKRIPEEDREEFKEMLHYAFSPHKEEVDYDDISPTYQKFIRKFNLPLKRSSKWWKYQRLSHWNKPVYCFLWEQNKDIRGYVLYSVEKNSEHDWKKELNVSELIYETEEAFYQLLRFLYNHGSQMNRITLPSPLPNGLSLLDLLDDPQEIEAKEKPGIMVRCIDVEAAIETLPLPEGLESNLIISVEDPLLEENSGNYSLDFDGNSFPEINRLNREGTKPDLSLDIGSLTKLYTGYLSPSEAITAGNLTLKNEDKLPLLREIFPKQRTFFPEGF